MGIIADLQAKLEAQRNEALKQGFIPMDDRIGGMYYRGNQNMGFGRQQMGGMYGGMPQYSGGMSGKGGQKQTSGMVGEKFYPVDRPPVFPRPYEFSGIRNQDFGGRYGEALQQYQGAFPRTQSPYQTPPSVFGILGRDTMGYGMPQGYGMNPYQGFQPRYNPYAGGMSGKGGQRGGNYMGGMGYRPQPNYYLSPFGGPFPLNQFAPYNPYAGANFYSNLMGMGGYNYRPQRMAPYEPANILDMGGDPLDGGPTPPINNSEVTNGGTPDNQPEATSVGTSPLTAEQLAALQKYWADNPFMFSGF